MKTSVTRWVAPLLASMPMLAIGQALQRTEPGTLPTPTAFTNYQAYRDIEPGDWRRLNETVGTAALKSAAPPAAAPASSMASPARPAMPMPSAAPKAMPHHMHRGGHDQMHGGRP
ncbi:hypothetical protein [Ideonella alba]|uniref:Uncharacterized protein n=1 Tax=Ideonella alba TaxID=2824118 RepID=A0A940YCZ6_9BURK|nr:hypothetical protein [Ideonella alba]MBQ0932365.1 hypothetical protein [Ideonella alba]